MGDFSAMKEISNPFSFNECFFCGTKNPESMALRFFWDVENKEMHTELTFPRQYAGQGKVIHGGFQMGVLDEITGWAAVYLSRNMVVTSDMQVRFLKPLYIGEKTRATARLISIAEPKITVEGELKNALGEVCTTATAVFHMLSEKRYRSIIEGGEKR